jgi:hypothetical protein
LCGLIIQQVYKPITSIKDGRSEIQLDPFGLIIQQVYKPITSIKDGRSEIQLDPFGSVPQVSLSI